MCTQEISVLVRCNIMFKSADKSTISQLMVSDCRRSKFDSRDITKNIQYLHKHYTESIDLVKTTNMTGDVLLSLMFICKGVASVL